jgi:S1-C subfamily serine protease
MRRQIGVLLLTVVTASGCGGRSVQVQTQIQASYERGLKDLELNQSKSSSCDAGWAASPNGYVIALGPWAEEAGLRLGDKITKIAGAAVEGSATVAREQIRAPAGGPLVIDVTRSGKEIVVSLPCRSGHARYVAYKETLEAGARGDWDRCIEASRELRRSLGFVASGFLQFEYECLRAKDPPSNSAEGRSLWQLYYELARVMLRESRYVPGGVDEVRGRIVQAASELRQARYAALAADLEVQLRGALAAQAFEPSPRPAAGAATSQATAFAVTSDGRFLTAFHVVNEAKRITISCPGQEAVPATLSKSDQAADVAVLSIGRPTVRYLPLIASPVLMVGDPVFTVGFPVAAILGVEPKFTDGSISALSGPGDRVSLIQISVPVQPGNSGGPLVNNQGQVVGVVISSAAVNAFLRGTGTLPQNINWAVKTDYASLLFEAPSPPPPAISRAEAIERAMKATCLVKAERE